MTSQEDVAREMLFSKRKRSFDENFQFEDIIEDIGSNGKFQKRLNIIFNCFSMLFTTLSSYSKLIAITVPDHWCHAPGWEATNLSAEAWKNLTIPREDTDYSKCMMYKNPGEGNETIPCTSGWEYDSTWFSATAASQANWVCDKAIYPSIVFSAGQFISIPIGVLLCYIGDRFGRRLEYLLSTALIAISRTFLTVSTSIFPLYIALSVFAEASLLPSNESCLSVGIELTAIRHRSTLNFMSFLAFCFGTILMALMAWLLRNWVYFVLFASVPCFIPLLFQSYFPESPRWLISKGRPDEAVKILERIATVNKKPFPQDAKRKIHFLSEKRSPNMSFKSVLTNRNLLKNTVLLMCGKSAAALVVFTLLFSNTSFGENPFLAYIGQGALQIPAVVVSHFAGNILGRRATHSFILLAAGLLSGVMIYLTSGSSPQWTLTVGSLALQFFSHCSLVLSNLQSIEIHPTCIRQISLAVEYVVISCVLCLPPYVAYLGERLGSEYMFLLLTFALLAASILISFVPESLNEKLPETMEDAAVYGCQQKYWSLPSRKQSTRGIEKLCSDAS